MSRRIPSQCEGGTSVNELRDIFLQSDKISLFSFQIVWTYRQNYEPRVTNNCLTFDPASEHMVLSAGNLHFFRFLCVLILPAACLFNYT